MVDQAGADVSSRLANREDELGEVEKFIREIEVKTAEHFLLNFFGLPGFGKTTLLRHIWVLYERSLPASFVSVGRYVDDDQFDLCGLLVGIIRQLDERLPKRLTSLPSDFDRSTNEMWLAEQLLDLVTAASAYG